MRWQAMLLGLLLLMPAAPTFADTQVNACGRYSIWVPDAWKITIENEKLSAESRDGELYMIAGPIEDKFADLIDGDVTEFIEDELQDMKITSDRRDKLAGLEARILQGTGTDEGSRVFTAAALDPSENEGLIEVLIHGAPAAMKRPANKAIVDRILQSFKPSPTASDMQVNPCGKFAIWIPDRWRITFESERLTAQSRDNELYVVVAPIEDASAQLLDDDVGDFIEAALKDMKITSDERTKLQGVEARVMEGTGTDDGDMLYRAVALKPSPNAGVIEMLIYGGPRAMTRPATKEIVDHIVRSFKPN